MNTYSGRIVNMFLQRTCEAAFFLLGSLLLLSPSGAAWGCACGCNIFDVGTSSLMANHSGGFVYVDYDYMDQNKNWSGTKQAPAANNADREIRTNFYFAGLDYQFSRKWGVKTEIPVFDRHFTTDNNPNWPVGAPDIQSFTHAAIGDLRLIAVYTGLSPDMSTGIEFGLKVPTGDSTYPNFDFDTEIGTGSTDILLGGYHAGQLNANGTYEWFANAQLDQPVVHAYSYEPGAELVGALGLYYNDWTVNGTKIAPIAQVLGAQRWRDSLSAADPTDSGYAHVILSPGVEIHVADYRIYTDIEFPVWQNYDGNQLVATDAIKVNIGRSF